MGRYETLKVERARTNEIFGPLLRREREARGLLQRDLAEVLRIDGRELGRIELCERLPLKAEQIRRLEKRFGFNALELLAAAALDRGALDVEGLSLDQVRAVAAFAERVRAGKSALALAPELAKGASSEHCDCQPPSGMCGDWNGSGDVCIHCGKPDRSASSSAKGEAPDDAIS